jgi:hypothetical protein
MARYTLTVSPNYVKDWSVNDAIRELLQNAIDQQSMNASNSMSIDIDDDTLTISNKTSSLSKSTLLLGGGTKSDTTDTIGQFGEGYKVALLVLLREGISVTINNYSANEVWTPKIINSRVYESQVLAIDIEKASNTFVPSHSLEIVISNLPEPENILQEIYLDHRDHEVLFSNDKVSVLDEFEAGNIYIRGLFLANIKELNYGYDFEPNIIKVGRDRNIVDSFNIRWEASLVWAQNAHDYEDKTLKLIESKSADVEYFNSHSHYVGVSFKEHITDQYKDTYVASSDDQVASFNNSISASDIKIVPTYIAKIMHDNVYYKQNIIVEKKSIREQLEDLASLWHKDGVLGDYEYDDILELIDKVEN